MAQQIVTVFGGSGFVGRYVVQRLAERGCIVRVAVRRPEEALFLKPMGDVGQITPIACNLRVEASVRQVLAGATHAVNLVGILFERGNQTFQAVHVEGARRVARIAAESGLQGLLQVSALGAAADSPAAYGRSKAAGEAAVREAFPQAVVVRPSLVIGPEDDFFNRFAAMARLLPALPLIGGGHTKFQPVWVGDVAEGSARALLDPAAAGRLFEFAGPKAYSFRQLMELMLGVIQRHRLLLALPPGLAQFQARFLEMLPKPPLTRDQLLMLERDSLPSGRHPGLADLGIVPQAIEAILPTYLDRYRRGGRFARAA